MCPYRNLLRRYYPRSHHSCHIPSYLLYSFHCCIEIVHARILPEELLWLSNAVRHCYPRSHHSCHIPSWLWYSFHCYIQIAHTRILPEGRLLDLSNFLLPSPIFEGTDLLGICELFDECFRNNLTMSSTLSILFDGKLTRQRNLHSKDKSLQNKYMSQWLSRRGYTRCCWWQDHGMKQNHNCWHTPCKPGLLDIVERLLLALSPNHIIRWDLQLCPYILIQTLQLCCI